MNMVVQDPLFRVFEMDQHQFRNNVMEGQSDNSTDANYTVNGTGQQPSGDVGQSSHDADADNYTVPASLSENAQLPGYGHVEALSDESARYPAEAHSSSVTGPNDLHTGQGDYLSTRSRPTSEQPGSHATAVARRAVIDDERLTRRIGARSSLLPDDLEDWYGGIRPNLNLLYGGSRASGEGTRSSPSEEIVSNSLAELTFFSSGQNEDEKTCPICLENFKNMERLGRLGICLHEFHVGCITEWLGRKSICPVCRSPVEDI